MSSTWIGIGKKKNRFESKQRTTFLWKLTNDNAKEIIFVCKLVKIVFHCSLFMRMENENLCAREQDTQRQSEKWIKRRMNGFPATLHCFVLSALWFHFPKLNRNYASSMNRRISLSFKCDTDSIVAIPGAKESVFFFHSLINDSVNIIYFAIIK